ncbi:cupin domain-containing protein [Henriciella sp.]|uniref:cupin domain-containing protein n=1 Tax=Henriciella sp. TaxID=1968823 RepID=UPI002612B723|nr:cupin domain-containing protein [Henriciella sp.]
MPGISGDLGANEIIRLLGLKQHPEGGHFAEVYRSEGEGRAACTTIYYLLQADEVSAWHRVDAVEVWAWHAGGPLSLTIAPPDGKRVQANMLGPDLRARQMPHLVVPKNHWQTAESLGAWTLVSCFVAPGFEFSGFELAPEGWRPET